MGMWVSLWASDDAEEPLNSSEVIQGWWGPKIAPCSLMVAYKYDTVYQQAYQQQSLRTLLKGQQALIAQVRLQVLHTNIIRLQATPAAADKTYSQLLSEADGVIQKIEAWTQQYPYAYFRVMG